MEEWRPVVGFDGLYEVSSYGRIKSLPKKGVPTERILKPNIPTKNMKYYAIGLTKDGVKKTFAVHRLVCNTFLGINSLHINHINSNSLDNNLSNLEYVSRRENTNHSYNGRRKCLLGVQKRPSGKFMSMISIKGNKLYLGQFDTEQQAHEAYISHCNKIGESKYAR